MAAAPVHHNMTKTFFQLDLFNSDLSSRKVKPEHKKIKNNKDLEQFEYLPYTKNVVPAA